MATMTATITVMSSREFVVRNPDIFFQIVLFKQTNLASQEANSYTNICKSLHVSFNPSPAFHTCSATDFTCDNGRCVPLSYTCDYTNDCGDNSDEQGCPFPTCNPATEFTCANGRCISASFVCDGYNDCRDNATSDEINCRE